VIYLHHSSNYSNASAMKKIVLFSVILIGLTACVVSKKKFDQLNLEKNGLEVDKDECSKSLESEKESNKELNAQVEALEAKVNELEQERSGLQGELDTLKNQYERQIELSNKDASELNNLRKSLNQKQSELIAKTNELNSESEKLKLALGNLDSKNDELNRKDSILKSDRLYIDSLIIALEEREQRVLELETILSKQEEVVEKIRSKVSDALLSFSSDELQVEVKDGKVYVSLAQNLLFKSGSYNLDSKGAKALESLAEVLIKQEDIDIIVEGHTDNVPYKGSGAVKDNWDLSVLRATAVVRELQGAGLDPTHLIPTGRAEYIPKQEGDSSEARALNRRIEIIISPSLQELYELLETEK